MDRTEQPPLKKALVRNTRKPTPPTKSRRDTNREIAIIPKLNLNGKTNKTGNVRKSKTPVESAPRVDHDLGVPEVNSSKNLQQKLLNLKENVPKKPVKPESQTMMNELITKSVNFPQDRTVFKNLIPLIVTKLKDVAEQSVLQRGELNPAAGADVQPDFTKFTKHRQMTEYSYNTRSTGRSCCLIRSYKGSKHYWNHVYLN